MDQPEISEPLAIIGMGCRFPGAADLDRFRSLVFEGRCAIGELPPSRFDQSLYYDARPGAYGKSYCRIGGWIEDSPFDGSALGLPRELDASRDRAHLWALDVARATLAHAGLRAGDLKDTNTAVVLGHSRGSMVTADVAFAMAAEELLTALDSIDSASLLSAEERGAVKARVVDTLRARYPRTSWDGSPGSITSAMAGVVAAALGVTGPHHVVDAACASSFAALDIAGRALRQRRVDMALVGGVSFSQQPSVILFAQSRALSAQGSFPFDARANGFVSSDGVGMVLLERLDDARAGGRRIHGVVRGVGGSCDGRGKGLWAPRKEGQVRAIEQALERSGVDPRAIGLIEAHGTSTALGDATEVAALSEALAPRLRPGFRIAIGSVKGNIGHCREAAGMAGLIKALLALQQRRIPPSIGYEQANPDIRWDETPLRIADRVRPWPRTTLPRAALVNSFGIGGLNYQVVVEEPPAPGRRSPRARTENVQRVAKPPATPREPIAIVGLGGLFPGSSSVGELWTALKEGRTSVGDVPAARWPASIYHRAGQAAPWRTYAVRGGFIDGPRPDGRRFRMPPALAAEIDPLQLILLEAAAAAFADAGIDLERAERRRISVIVGSGFGSDHALLLTIALRVPELSAALAGALEQGRLSPPDAARVVGEMEAALRRRLPRINEDSSGSFSSSTLASRIAKTFDLGGATCAVDASCASSLAALEAACESLWDRACDLVLCGGGDRSLRAQRFETLSAAGCLSRGERCAPFEAGADGVLPAEGAGLLVVERLSDALRAGRRVHAVVRGVGSASDGEWRAPFEPSPRGLRLALGRAWQAAGVAPSRAAFVEAHGDGTPVRDRAETAAMREVLLPGRASSLPVGSVKANIGHAQGAAAAVSLVKAALALRERELPPQPSPGESSPGLGPAMALPRAPQALPPDAPVFAGVSAMGLGGISAHAVLATAPPSARLGLAGVATPIAREPVVFRAATREELDRRLASLGTAARRSLESGASRGSGPVAVALTPGPDASERLETARVALRADGARTLPGSGFALADGSHAGELCFLFPGQGSAHAGMLREIAAAYAPAGRRLREIDAVLVRLGHDPLSQVMWEEPSRLAEVAWTQLAALGGGVMMAEVAAVHGLVPGLVSGHSYGDYPALVVAGVLSLSRAVELTLARCAAIVDAGVPGRMAAVLAPREKVAALTAGLPGFAEESNVNGPAQVVVSGDETAIEALLERCRRQGVEARRLSVPGAFHSKLMAPAAERFAASLRAEDFAPPRVRFLSSVCGRELRSPEELREALAMQLTAPLDFVSQMEAAHAAGFRRFVEVGPGGALAALVSSILGPRALAVSLDDRKRPGVAAVERALAALRAADSGEGAPWDAPASGPALFDEREWLDLSRDPRWPAFWDSARPSLRSFARDLFARLPATATAEVRFFDATTKRSAAGAARPPTGERPASDGPAADTRAPDAEPREAAIRAILLEQVIELTGYPADLVGFDLDMEADLGIDSVKQAQIFGRMRERFDLRTDDRLALRDFPTLGHVLRYVLVKTEAEPAPEPPAARTDADEAPAETVQVGAGLPILHLEGTPYEMGLRHGHEQRDAIRRLVGEYEAFVGAERLSRDVLQQALERPSDFLDEDALEEIRGLAAGSGLPERHLVAYNIDAAVFSEYGPLGAPASGCAQAGLAASRHRAAGVAGPLHAVNEDSALALYLRDALTRVVQVRRPARGVPHLIFSFAGQVGGLNGANARGLVATSCVLLDRIQPRSSRAGLVHGVLVRRILQEADDVASALEVARGQRRRGAWSVLLSHAREAELTCFEYDDASWTQKRGLEGHLASNHVRLSPAGDAPAHSRHRLQRLEDLLGGGPAPVGVADLQRALRDRFDHGRRRAVAHPTMSTVCRVDNVMGLVADVAAGRLSVTAGPPANGEEPAWVTLDLAGLLAKPEVASAAPAPAVMTRHVIRTVAEPLVSSNGAAYRPSRLLVAGDGAVARTLAERMERRGTRVEVVALDADSETAQGRVRSWLEADHGDLCLLAGISGAGGTDAIETSYRIAQAWVTRVQERAPAVAPTLSAVTALGGLLGYGSLSGARPEGGAVLGLLKALRREFPAIRVKALDTEPEAEAGSVADAWLAEMDGGEDRVEVGHFRGRRHVPRLLPAPARTDPTRLAALRALPYVLVTGGARGITAEAALALARAGVRKLHLLGRTPADPRVESWRELHATGREALADDVLARLRAERGRVSPVEWQEAVGAIERAIEVDGTLRRLREAGAETAYHAVDVADASALASTLDAIRREDGPVRAIVHGAGVERSRAFTAKTVDELRATLAPKVGGLRDLLALASPEHLELLVAFSSVSGRFGGLGQADYSLANELMARLVGQYAWEHPRCRAVSICWPAWDEVGMAARGDTRTRLAAAGQSLMSPAEGARHFMDELLAAGAEPEVTVTDGGGGLDADGILPEDALSPARRRVVDVAARLALSDVVLEAGPDRAAIECALDTKRDVFLREHRRKGRPLLPAVAVLELLAECSSLLGAEEPLELADVTIHAPFKPAPGSRAVVRANAYSAGAGWDLSVSADVRSRDGALLESDRRLASARMPAASAVGAMPPVPGTGPRGRGVAFVYPEGNRDDAVVHHGPSLRGLLAITLGEADLHEAHLVSLPAAALRPHIGSTRWIVAAPAMDACLQACSAVARATLGVLALPVGFGRLWLSAAPAPGERCRVLVRMRGQDGETIRFDFWLVTADGRLVAAVKDYRARVLASLAGRPPAAAPPRLLDGRA